MYFQWYFREIVNNRPVSRKSIKLKLRKKYFDNIQISPNVKESLVSLHFLYSAGYQKWWGFKKKRFMLFLTPAPSLFWKNIIVRGVFMRKYKSSKLNMPTIWPSHVQLLETKSHNENEEQQLDKPTNWYDAFLLTITFVAIAKFSPISNPPKCWAQSKLVIFPLNPVTQPPNQPFDIPEK